MYHASFVVYFYFFGSKYLAIIRIISQDFDLISIFNLSILYPQENLFWFISFNLCVDSEESNQISHAPIEIFSFIDATLKGGVQMMYN